MSKVKDSTKKVKSKIDAIKKINDNPSVLTDSLYDKYLKDLPSTDELFGKKTDDFLKKRISKKQNHQNIFEQMIDLVDTFINKGDTNKPIGEFKRTNKSIENLKIGKQKIKKHALTAANRTLDNSKTIVLDNVSKIFFAGDGICGTNQTFVIDDITISPKEIDFLNILTMNPDNGIGKIVYEPLKTTTDKIKFDRELYKLFVPSETIYNFISLNNNSLFDIKFKSDTQKYVVSGLQYEAFNTFFDEYYTSITFPDIEHIIKTSMLLTIQGDGSETTLFNKSLDKLERLLQKLMSVCGNQTKRDVLQNLNPIDLFDETDEDIEYYFNFDDVEGIDLDAEDARRRGVLKFRDCNNFEVPKNTTMIEDFIYFSEKDNIVTTLDNILNRVATDAYEKSDSTISLENFKLSMMNMFILNIPKAIISSILTPKIFLPIVIAYKAIKNIITDIDIYDLMKKLSKLFYSIIKDLFWFFIREFWKLIKPELIKFLSILVAKIIKNKNKRYLVIVTALIALLTRILQNGIDNCADLFDAVLVTINAALSAPRPFNIPGILLGLSHYLPGYSEDRAILNIMERVEASGISLGPIYGEPNKLVDLIASIVKGNSEEMDSNSFIAVSNQEITIPTPVGPITIPPGLLSSSGKLI